MPSSSKSTKSVWWLIRRFLPYLRPVRWHIALVSGLMLLSPLVAIMLLWLMKFLIDDVLVAKDVDILPAIAGAYVLLVGSKLAIDYSLRRIEAAITERIDQNVRVDFYRHLISVSPGTLRKFGVGDLLAHLEADVDSSKF